MQVLLVPASIQRSAAAPAFSILSYSIQGLRCCAPSSFGQELGTLGLGGVYSTSCDSYILFGTVFKTHEARTQRPQLETPWTAVASPGVLKASQAGRARVVSVRQTRPFQNKHHNPCGEWGTLCCQDPLWAAAKAACSQVLGNLRKRRGTYAMTGVPGFSFIFIPAGQLSILCKSSMHEPHCWLYRPPHLV